MALASAGCNDQAMRTVLIIDDHASFRTTARALLEAEGFTVVGEAEDGRAGLDQIKRLRPDVVLLDIYLPDMDGFAVVRELPVNGGTQVILTSSRDGSDFGSLVAKSGARGFVAKAELSGGRLTALLE
jgi:DNA-binding NarL/FixJ family response regulator